MKYFTPEVYRAAYDQGEWQPFFDARARYEIDLAHADLPQEVKRFAGASLVADALIARVRWRTSEGSLEIALRCGDLQDGYFDLLFLYSGATLTETDGSALEQVARGTQTSIRFWNDCFVQEIERSSDDRFEHRLLFHERTIPCGIAIAIACTSLQIRQADRKNRQLPPWGKRFLKVP